MRISFRPSAWSVVMFGLSRGINHGSIDPFDWLFIWTSIELLDEITGGEFHPVRLVSHRLVDGPRQQLTKSETYS
jgi:hypothetical protein